jgi:tetraacyldisaccharide 4'-kinase
MNPLRLLLLPFSFIYSVITWFRNWLYDHNLLKTYKPEVPIISVGNISVGGTGKTPHCEFLIQVLTEHGFHVAYLSRGYGRKTKGFRWVRNNSLATEVGDEAVQVASKFPAIHVAVCENRSTGIKTIKSAYPDINVVILDDAFQHRKIKPTLNILLTDMARLYTQDYLLPFGKLRESSAGAKRADLIIITKTPTVFPVLLKKYLQKTISPKPYQRTFFTFYEYSDFIPVQESQSKCRSQAINHIFLLAGIENPLPLSEYLEQKGFFVHLKTYPDHHFFSSYEIASLINEFEAIPGKKKIILTTEKDLARMDEDLIHSLSQYPFYKIAVRVRFHESQEEEFIKFVINKIKEYGKG